MRNLDIKNTYKKDLKQILKQGWDAKKVNEVVTQLLNDEVLNHKLKDHALSGDLKDFRECHIFDDLVLIYKRSNEILSLYRIGRHQDLFKKY